MPFQAGSEDVVEEQRVWESEKKRFLARRREDPKYFSQRDVDRLQTLDFGTFHARYTEDVEPGQTTPYSGGEPAYRSGMSALY